MDDIVERVTNAMIEKWRETAHPATTPDVAYWRDMAHVAIREYRKATAEGFKLD